MPGCQVVHHDDETRWAECLKCHDVWFEDDEEED